MDATEEIKQKVDLVEYVGRFVALQKAGRNFRGLCPFHTEKTPSFYVFPDRGSWRCFGSCGEGGDLFSFVQKRENLDFRGALRELATEAGVQLSAESSQRRSRLEKLSAVLSAAVDYYQRRFEGEEGRDARAYIFEKRGITLDAAAAFHIGWAPDDWRALRNHLNARGYDDADIVAAGLLVENESGGQPYDRFRGRVIIPIADERGQFVGMGGRGLHGEEPKYLNSPQSELFDKGRTLYGLHLAAAAIRESGTVVVVEGYMDVIGPWQAGFKNVVATMGTSLTEHHAALLRRFAKRVVLAMDPDAAGMNAAERAGGLFLGLDSPEHAARSARQADDMASTHQLELRVAPLPPGRDPDEIARDDPEGWARAIDQAVPYAEFLLRRLMGPQPPDSPVEARRIVDRIRPVLLAVQDPVERAMYVQRVARHLGIVEAAVFERLRAGGGGRRAVRPPDQEAPPEEEYLLSFLLRYPELRLQFKSIPETLFTRAVDREVFRRWAGGEGFEDLPTDDPLARHVKALGARRLPPLTPAEAVLAVREKIGRITRDRLIQHQAAMSEHLAEAEKSVGATRLATLAAEAWRGVLPAPEDRPFAETVIEDLELGLSIHRREEPGATV
ncbi:MAG: DNA primase [Dehalococcoidia bacterium]|nr:DNA primase [Dehalococcoidia bacterium]